MAIVGRGPKMATFARGPQSGGTGVEEQGELVECDRVLALRVLGLTEQAWSGIRTDGG